MKRLIVITAVSLVLAACDADDITKLMQGGEVNSSIERNFSQEQLAKGAILFQKNCASCHGDQGQGAVSWQKRNKSGKFPAPPLNGTGHTWHHSTDVLKYTIRNGTGKIGGNMPAFKDKISNSEIDDVLVFIKDKWPQPLYQAWYRTDEMARKK